MQGKTRVSIVLPHPVADVWSVIANFDEYRWGEGVGPAVVEQDEVNRPGAIRTFTYYGQRSRQRLTAYDPAEHSMSWESVEPFDATLSHYLATIRVTPVTASDDSFVEWSVVFEASAEAVDKWRDHQRIEFQKSLERLNLCTDWRRRGLS